MRQVTTEILTLNEFIERRKLGRTSVFSRIKDGSYVEGLDYIADGSDKKFFWPCREMIQRDLLLMANLEMSASPRPESQVANTAIESASFIQKASQSTEDMIRPVISRRKAVPQIMNSRPAGKTPAFQVRRQTVQTA